MFQWDLLAFIWCQRIPPEQSETETIRSLLLCVAQKPDSHETAVVWVRWRVWIFVSQTQACLWKKVWFMLLLETSKETQDDWSHCRGICCTSLEPVNVSLAGRPAQRIGPGKQTATIPIRDPGKMSGVSVFSNYVQVIKGGIRQADLHDSCSL